MAFVEIYPNNKSGKKFSDTYFKRYKDYNDCMEWYDDGNEIVVLLNTKTNEEAVYERRGSLYCLADRFCIYMNVDTDCEFLENNRKIRHMLYEEALAAGFPVELPGTMHRFLVDVTAIVYSSFLVDAEDYEKAETIAFELAHNAEFCKERLTYNDVSESIDTTEISQIENWHGEEYPVVTINDLAEYKTKQYINERFGMSE